MKFRLGHFLFTSLLLSLSMGSFAGTITPEIWVNIDIQVRTLTIQGMQQRYHLLLQQADIAEQSAHDAITQNKIIAVYQGNSTTPIKHINYGQRQNNLIQKWLATNTEQQVKREALDVLFTSELKRMSALQQSQSNVE